MRLMAWILFVIFLLLAGFFMVDNFHGSPALIQNVVVSSLTPTSTIIDVKDFGALGNTTAISDASMIAGSSTLTSASQYTFTSADVGKEIVVGGAGQNSYASSTNLVATILSISNGSAILSANAVHAVYSSPADFGTVDTAAIANAIAAAYGKELYFPPGIYLLSNLHAQGMHFKNWTGAISFSPDAEVMCDSMTSVHDCVFIENSSNVTVDGFQGRMAGIGTQAKSLVGVGGSMLRLFFDTNVQVTNAHIYNSANAGLYDEDDTDASFSNIYIASTSVNAFISVSSLRTNAVNVTAENSGDSGFEVDSAASSTPPYNWLQNNSLVASNIVVKNSYAGINVTGSNVTISNFSVDGTCLGGIGVHTYFNGSARGIFVDQVQISSGTITNLGKYNGPYLGSYCTPAIQLSAGDGIYWSDVGKVSFNNIKITNTMNHPIYGDAGATGIADVALDNITITDGTGDALLENNRTLALTNSSMVSSTGNWRISGNGYVTLTNDTAYDVCLNTAICSNRSFELGGNGTINATNLKTIDDQAIPTGYVFFETGTTNPSLFSGINGLIANGKFVIKLFSSSTVSLMNDLTPPQATITAPVSGKSVSGILPVLVSASDNVGIAKVELYLDNVLKATDPGSSGTYAFSIDTASLLNGTHNLLVRAYDAAGNGGTSSSVTVTVNNPILTPPFAISGITISQITETSARIMVTTNAPASVAVGYSSTGAGNTTVPSSYLTTTYIDLGNLTPGTLYRFHIIATNASGTSISSGIYTFTTQASSPAINTGGEGEGNSLPIVIHATSSQTQAQASTSPSSTPSSSSEPLLFPRTLKPGDAGPDVTLLQNTLKSLGFLSVTTPSTGYFGSLTSHALMLFQGSHNLTITGSLTPESQNLMNKVLGADPALGRNVLSGIQSSSTLPTTPNTPITSPSTHPSSSQTLSSRMSLGSTGPEVIALQKLLLQDGDYPQGIISGYYGSLTEKAVQAFQSKYGIISYGTPDTTGYGAVGPKTLGEMRGVDKDF